MYVYCGTLLTSFGPCLRILGIYNRFPGMTQQYVDAVLSLIVDVLGEVVQGEKVPRYFF